MSVMFFLHELWVFGKFLLNFFSIQKEMFFFQTLHSSVGQRVLLHQI